MFSTVEAHFANCCTGDCVVCSKAHGGARAPYMRQEVFDALVKQLADMRFAGTIQLGGDGDAFLHPSFMGFLRRLRLVLPKTHLCLYTNGFSLTPDRADAIVKERLLDEMQTRIDSLDAETYRRSTRLELPLILDNLRHLAEVNDHAHLCLIYFPLYLYPTYCRRILGKEPTYFSMRRLDESNLRDEFDALRRFAADWKAKNPVEVRRTGICLWAERTDCEYSDFPCPQLEDNPKGAWGRQVYVLGDGDVMACPYGDGQDEFVYGNILKTPLPELWDSPKKQAFAAQVRSRTKERHPRHCVNPKCCLMWDSLP